MRFSFAKNRDDEYFLCPKRLLSEKMITIVAHFRAPVANFISSGRNYGQNAEDGPVIGAAMRSLPLSRLPQCLSVTLNWVTLESQKHDPNLMLVLDLNKMLRTKVFDLVI